LLGEVVSLDCTELSRDKTITRFEIDHLSGVRSPRRIDAGHVLQARDLIAKVEANELELASKFLPPDENNT